MLASSLQPDERGNVSSKCVPVGGRVKTFERIEHYEKQFTLTLRIPDKPIGIMIPHGVFRRVNGSHLVHLSCLNGRENLVALSFKLIISHESTCWIFVHCNWLPPR